ncbi:hypothetical protein C8Q80DRAFT_1117409 [Daedaleopsis nitida]|nr:hypothetical protein C8Q80DRAFT_1117409 [Daedaleopsis nitida]
MSSTIHARMQALSFDDACDKPSETPPVDCSSFPPLDEYHHPEYTGIFYYGIYVREGALEEYAKRVNPDAVNHCSSVQYFYALDHLRWIVNDESLDVQRAVLKPRHKKAMPCITEPETATILCLYPPEKAVKNRISAEKVKRLVDALGCEPDWFEIFFWC